MKVLVFGNVGSGKTTIIRKLKDIFPFEIISIDDFRRKYGDGSKEKELKARQKFLLAVRKNENQFIECLGVGLVADKLFKLLCLTSEIIVCIIVISSKDICLSRLSIRNWDIPFPYPVDKVNSLIDRTSEKIATNEIEKLWSKRENTIIIRKINELPSELENTLIEIIGIIQQQFKNEGNRINVK